MSLEIVVFSEEEEHVRVLKMLAPRIYGDVVVMDGNTLTDIPLDEVLDTHLLTKSSLTVLGKEFDMRKGGKGAKNDVESTDIFGISQWTELRL